MLIAIPLFDRFTALDAIGPFQVLVQLPGATTVFVAERPGPVTDESRVLTLHAEAAFADVPQPDVIVVPGGPGEAAHRDGGPLRDWLIAADQTSTWTTSVCTGSLILAGAGLLDGRPATTNWLAMDELARLGAKPRQERYVFDGKYATAAGVSAGIDMALALAGRLVGDDSARRFQLGIEYDPQPPYNAGSPATAPAEIVADLRARSRFARA
ncbi:MAG TPA: DJ-1/PfpI family protein [Trebonia sp.]|jgi:transcriptional regulator GlxA family with amidase domain|nr:DJ-1/PfpI family protein [Trebonia sp.]